MFCHQKYFQLQNVLCYPKIFSTPKFLCYPKSFQLQVFVTQNLFYFQNVLCYPKSFLFSKCFVLSKNFLIPKCFVLPEILSSVTITWGSVGCGGSSVLSRGGSVTWSAIPSQENSLQLKCQKKKSFTLILWHRWIRHQRDQGRKEGEGGWPTGGDHLAS